MILIHGKVCIGSCLLIPVVITICALYAYHINAKRAPDDPKKKDYSPYAPWLAPITLPLLALINIAFFILFSLAFGFFLVIFPFTMLLFRKPFLIKWILKQAQKVGNWMLKINTELLRIAGFHPTSITASV